MLRVNVSVPGCSCWHLVLVQSVWTSGGDSAALASAGCFAPRCYKALCWGLVRVLLGLEVSPFIPGLFEIVVELGYVHVDVAHRLS